MRPSQFLDKQLLDVIQWSEPEAGALACRYPMLDTEIQSGAWLAVRESEMALFVDQERGADIFGPGLYALNAANLPVLANAKNWGKGFASPFKSDVYFFSMMDEFDQTWGTVAPITLRDVEGDAIRVRGYGSYSYRIADVRTFFAQVSGARESYFIYDLDDRLRGIIVACMAGMLSGDELLGVGLTAAAGVPSDSLVEQIKPAFAALGLELTRFSVGALSLEDEGQTSFDERMGMSMAGDTQHAAGAMGCECCGAAMRAEHDVLKCDYCHAVVAAGAGDDSAGASAEFEGRACPACEIPLMQATVGGATLLYCTRCDGMLVAMEEFESLVAAARALPGGTAVVAAAESPAAVDCPECGRTMGMSFYAGDVMIESCEDCGLNWLDHGELARIAHAPVSDSGVVSTSGTYFNPARVDSSADFNINA